MTHVGKRTLCVVMLMIMILPGCSVRASSASSSSEDWETACVSGHEAIYIDPAGDTFEFELTGDRC